jgi:RNA polymerase sigma-70 factor (ECF subfamily)
VKNSDWNDIEASINGDAEAYKRLVQKYEEQITRLMWRFAPNRTTCEELVQSVFVEAYFSLKGYKGKAPLLHWLKRIGTRVGYGFWKEKDKARKFLPLQDDDFIEKRSKDSIDADESSEILHALLSRLSRPDRLVLMLMYFENCTIEEISKRTGYTHSSVKSRAMRARKKIKIIAERERLLEKLEWTH